MTLLKSRRAPGILQRPSAGRKFPTHLPTTFRPLMDMSSAATVTSRHPIGPLSGHAPATPLHSAGCLRADLGSSPLPKVPTPTPRLARPQSIPVSRSPIAGYQLVRALHNPLDTPIPSVAQLEAELADHPVSAQPRARAKQPAGPASSPMAAPIKRQPMPKPAAGTKKAPRA